MQDALKDLPQVALKLIEADRPKLGEVVNSWWFVPNALNKFTVSPRNDLTDNDDGSLTLYFQNAAPGT